MLLLILLTAQNAYTASAPLPDHLPFYMSIKHLGQYAEPPFN